MLTGLIQNRALQISNILDYAVRAHGRREIVSRLIDEPLFRYDYSGLGRRAARLAHGLVAMGAKAGDTFSSLAWTTHRHLELFYAVPCKIARASCRERGCQSV